MYLQSRLIKIYCSVFVLCYYLVIGGGYLYPLPFILKRHSKKGLNYEKNRLNRINSINSNSNDYTKHISRTDIHSNISFTNRNKSNTYYNY